MRRASVSIALLALALLAAVPLGTAAAAPLGGQSMTLTASTHAAGAHHVRLTIALTYPMQCGYPGAGPVVVTFPAAAKLPKRFAAGSVKLDKKAATAKINGRNVTVTVPPPTGVLCGTVGPGTARLTFTRAAGIRNPARAGSYRFAATHGKRAFSAKLAIRAAA